MCEHPIPLRRRDKLREKFKAGKTFKWLSRKTEEQGSSTGHSTQAPNDTSTHSIIEGVGPGNSSTHSAQSASTPEVPPHTIVPALPSHEAVLANTETASPNSRQPTSSLLAISEPVVPIMQTVTASPAPQASSSSASPIPNTTTDSTPQSQPAAASSTPRNLWLEAFQKLSEKNQEIISTFQTVSGSDSETQDFSGTDIDKLLELTRKVQEQCETRRWKIPFRGQDIIVRDVAGKIIFWLMKFKDVGDIAVNYDPVHAALPWAGIRLLLQAAIGEHEQMGDLIIATEKLTHLLQRCRIYERLYEPKTVAPDVLHNLQNALIHLYTHMFEITVLCHRLFAKNALKRAVHSLYSPEEIAKLLQTCEDLEPEVEYEAHNCERDRSQNANAETEKLLRHLSEPVLRVDESVLDLLERTGERERFEILDWISRVLYGANHQRISEKRTRETCKWLLNHERYQGWRSSSASTILWLCGNPGAGKTFLTSKVIDEVQASLQSKPNQEAFAFFYCNRNEPERRDPLSALRASVRQLSTIASDKQSMQRELKQFYSESRLNASEPTMQECKSILLKLINIYPQTTLVFDALDECEKLSRGELLEVLDKLIAEAVKPLKVFISSRPDDDIKRRLEKRANISIQATDNQDDITRFVNEQISKHSNWHAIRPELQTKIVETLQERSQGMFQWAFLQIKQLMELDLENDILDRLGKLPEDLKDAYDEIWHSMGKHEKEIAHRAFKWVMVASDPLDSEKLLPAIAQDGINDILQPLGGLTEEIVLKYCHNLLIIDPVRKVWVPSHLSVIEYIEDHLWRQSQAHCLVASVSLVLLQETLHYDREQRWANNAGQESTVQTEEALKDPLQKQGFEKLSYYARSYWVLHIRSVDQIRDDRLASHLQSFLGLPTQSSAAYQCWHRMLSREAPWKDVANISIGQLAPSSISAFAYCAFDLSTILPNWHGFNWVKDDIRSSKECTYLELAALGNAITTCRSLLRSGARVNDQSKSAYGSALATSVARGHKELALVLLKQGDADVNL